MMGYDNTHQDRTENKQVKSEKTLKMTERDIVTIVSGNTRKLASGSHIAVQISSGHFKVRSGHLNKHGSPETQITDPSIYRKPVKAKDELEMVKHILNYVNN